MWMFSAVGNVIQLVARAKTEALLELFGQDKSQ